MKNTTTPIVYLKPMYLGRPEVAAFTSLSESAWDTLVAKGEAPKPRQISKGRAGWLVEEIEEWGRNRPVSTMLPPKNSGYGRAGKPA